MVLRRSLCSQQSSPGRFTLRWSRRVGTAQSSPPPSSRSPHAVSICDRPFRYWTIRADATLRIVALCRMSELQHLHCSPESATEPPCPVLATYRGPQRQVFVAGWSVARAGNHIRQRPRGPPALFALDSSASTSSYPHGISIPSIAAPALSKASTDSGVRRFFQ